MAIRFKYDAAAVAIPQNEARQRFGQQLVLQQQKYNNDQRQSIRDNLYDQQKEYRQTAFQLQKAQTDRFVDEQRIKDQQAFAEKMQKTGLDAQEKRAQQEMQMRAREQEMRRLEQLKQQQQMDDFDGIASGEFDEQTSKEIKELWRKKNQIPIDDNLDEAMKSEALGKVEERLNGLRGARVKAPSMAEQANRNLSHYVPSLQQYATPEQLQELRKADPNIEVQVFQDGKMLPGPTPKQGPMTMQDYYRANDAKFDKDLAAKMAPLQDKVDDGTLTLKDGQSVRDLALQQMQDDYDFKQKALGGGQPVQGGQPAMPPTQSGQSAVPPSPAPAEQPPVLGMQDLEPTDNADGTTAVPGQPVGDPMMRPPMVADPSAEAALPATQGQPAAAPMRVQHQDGRIFEQSPDGNWKEVQPVAAQPIQQADGSMWQQSPTDGAWRQVPAAAPSQPVQVAQPAMQPARPLQPGEEEGGSTFAPRAPMVQQQPVETLPVDQTGMQPPPLPNEQEILSELFPQEAPVVANQAKQQAPAKAQAESPVNMIGEAIKTFESGTPEQQMELRKKLKSSPDGIAGLMAEAANNNPDAIKALDLMEKSISLTDALRDKAKKGKSSDTNTIVGELQTRRKLGEIDDKEYVSSVISAMGKPAKQIYEGIKNPPRKGFSLKGLSINDRFERNEKSTLSAIWDEMGMFDSRSSVRAFQKPPTMDEVITHAAMKGKMSRKDAEEWVYSQILGRNYVEQVQTYFDGKLGGGADRRRETKQNEKSAAWKPN